MRQSISFGNLEIGAIFVEREFGTDIQTCGGSGGEYENSRCNYHEDSSQQKLAWCHTEQYLQMLYS